VAVARGDEAAERQAAPAAGEATMQAERITLEALRAAPERVERSQVVGEPEREALLCYPKSFDTLLHCHARDVLLGWLAVRTDYLLSSQGADVELAERAVAELSYQHRCLVWIVTSPGPGMPFDPDRTPRPELPAWTQELDTFELFRVIDAYSTANLLRLQALRSLLAGAEEGKGSGRRASWSIFFGSLAESTGQTPAALMRDASLAEVLARVRITAAAHHEAAETARREAAERRAAAGSGSGEG
jgi:hypothetical protein